MRQVLAWAFAVLLVGACIALYVWLRLRGRRDEATLAAADAVDAWAYPRIERWQRELEHLRKDVAENTPRIKAAREEVDAIRGELEGHYFELGLTPEEIEQRTRNLRI